MRERKLIRKEYVDTAEYLEIPKAFFRNPKYMSMRNESKMAYGLMLDLLPQATENKWMNESGEVYVELPRTEMMRLLNIKGTQKAAQVVRELVECGLIVCKKGVGNRCNEIYL